MSSSPVSNTVCTSNLPHPEPSNPELCRTEGAAFLRTKGEAGTGNVVEAVRHARAVNGEIKRLTTMDPTELWAYSKNIQAPYELVKYVADNGRLPVVNFAAGGVATPADAGTCVATLAA
jgi:pyridoxal biosynthesis lyase PdxS